MRVHVPMWAGAPIAFLFLAGCSDAGDSYDSPVPEDGSGILPQPDDVTVNVNAVGVYPVNPRFDPDRLQLPAGTRVQVTFTNGDQGLIAQHNWVIDEIPGATSPTLAVGDSASFQFTTPSQAGEYTFYCSIGDHRARGMEGTLSVTVG